MVIRFTDASFHVSLQKNRGGLVLLPPARAERHFIYLIDYLYYCLILFILWFIYLSILFYLSHPAYKTTGVALCYYLLPGQNATTCTGYVGEMVTLIARQANLTLLARLVTSFADLGYL